MVLSRELLYELTKRNNAFLRKNLTRTFTADPFSATNLVSVSAPAFYDRHVVGLQVGKPTKEGKAQVTQTTLQNRRRITKKGKKSNQKAPGQSVTQKSVDTKKVTGNKSPALQVRGQRLNKAALRGAKLAKK